MSKDFKVKNGLQVTTNITASGHISGSIVEGQTLTADVFLSSPSASLTNITTTNITASGNISLADDKEIKLGNSNDLRIFHDPNNGVIRYNNIIVIII